MSSEREFSIDYLMDRIVSEQREQLPRTEIDALLNDAFSPRWLVLQSLLNKEINAKLNALALQDLSAEGGLVRLAQIQGEIKGLRRFFYVLEELHNNAQEETIQ